MFDQMFLVAHLYNSTSSYTTKPTAYFHVHNADSVFLNKNGVSLEDYECVKDTLTRETGLPMSLEHHYKFLELPPLEADQRMEGLKHYFGINHAGELITRGIEIRKHDAPNFKEFHQ
jgi:hypothetical protein